MRGVNRVTVPILECEFANDIEASPVDDVVGTTTNCFVKNKFSCMLLLATIQ